MKPTTRLTTLILTLGLLNACAPSSQDLSSLTCASGENCSNVELDTALEKSEHDEVSGAPTVDAMTIQWEETNRITPPYTKIEDTPEIPEQFKHLDPDKKVPRRAFAKALEFYTRHESKFKNQNYLAVIDFTQKSTKKRLYIINLKSGAVEPLLVAHGKNSDPDHDGFASKFSNIEGSLMSSLGAYMTAETYQGKYGYSLRLDGLESSNSLARQRAVVMHAANYVNPNSSPIGRSYGCPAIEFSVRDRTVNALKGGALIYAWYNQ